MDKSFSSGRRGIGEDKLCFSSGKTVLLMRLAWCSKKRLLSKIAPCGEGDETGEDEVIGDVEEGCFCYVNIG